MKKKKQTNKQTDKKHSAAIKKLFLGSLREQPHVLSFVWTLK